MTLAAGLWLLAGPWALLALIGRPERPARSR